MTTRQKSLVKQSFAEIREISGPVALLFYGRLFEIDPSLRPMFRQDIEVQGRKLMDMLTAVVDNIDGLDGPAPLLQGLGQRHAGYGVKLENYRTVSKALIWAFAQALGPEFDTDVKAAWTAVIDSVSAGMKEGAARLLALEK